jgi:hypothetical protein
MEQAGGWYALKIKGQRTLPFDECRAWRDKEDVQ